jgi:hypothetical protein
MAETSPETHTRTYARSWRASPPDGPRSTNFSLRQLGDRRDHAAAASAHVQARSFMCGMAGERSIAAFERAVVLMLCLLRSVRLPPLPEVDDSDGDCSNDHCGDDNEQ